MVPLARATSSMESLAATAVITSGVLSWLNTSRSSPELLCCGSESMCQRISRVSPTSLP
jgi:hypothetical protein